ncbi:MAG: glycosyltransferase [Planctomycetota bacterium]|nr:glycosyltransferase [Planctomycetota bacterium]
MKNTVEPPPSQLRRSPPTDKWTVGTAARLMHQKGLDTLIRAFAEFHVKVHDSRLLIAGEGPLEEDLKAMAARLGVSGSVEFVGHVDDIYEFFVSLHLFAMPSRWEGYPYTLLEAMSAGVPVVASDIPGISEALFHEFNGLLFAPDDERALAKALTRAHGEPRLLSSLAANARDMVACDGPEEFCRKLEYRYIRATEQFAGFHG